MLTNSIDLPPENMTEKIIKSNAKILMYFTDPDLKITPLAAMGTEKHISWDNMFEDINSKSLIPPKEIRYIVQAIIVLIEADRKKFSLPDLVDNNFMYKG